MRYLTSFALTLVFGHALAGEAKPFVVEPSSKAISSNHLVEPFGIETLGGVFTPFIEAGCSLPCTHTTVFSTAEDNQTQILIHLYRGHGTRVAKLTALGTLSISGIPSAPRGTPKVSVTLGAVGADLVISATEPSGAKLTIMRVVR